MIIYCDGGYKNIGNCQSVISWGIRAGDIESYGHIKIPSGDHKNRHEHVAFIEAVKFAKAHGGNTLTSRIYSDWITLQEINQCVQTQGITTKTIRAARLVFRGLDAIYSESILEEAAQWLMYANVFWVKGHGTTIDNRRADYLSTVAREIATGRAIPPAPYDDWIHDNHTLWVHQDGDGNKLPSYIPFTNFKRPEGPAHLLRMAGFEVPALYQVGNKPKPLTKKQKKRQRQKLLREALMCVQA